MPEEINADIKLDVPDCIWEEREKASCILWSFNFKIP